MSIGIVTGLTVTLSGCASIQNTQLAYRCNSNISAATAELEKASKEANKQSILWSRANSLIAAAKIQQKSEEFPGCINKTAQARHYINRSLQVSSL